MLKLIYNETFKWSETREIVADLKLTPPNQKRKKEICPIEHLLWFFHKASQKCENKSKLGISILWEYLFSDTDTLPVSRYFSNSTFSVLLKCLFAPDKLKDIHFELFLLSSDVN